jgi:CRP-like cAMP-binding protein
MKTTTPAALREVEPAKALPRSSLARLVAGHPFLHGMKSEHLAILTECAMLAEFKKGESIFREGDPANRFYLIRSGRVELETEVKESGPMLIQTIGPGDVLGWSWLFPPYYWRFDARAATPVKAIFFYGTRLREMCEQDPEFGYGVMKRTAEVVIKRLQAARKYLVELRTEGRT